jgi:hypothetical protein
VPAKVRKLVGSAKGYFRTFEKSALPTYLYLSALDLVSSSSYWSFQAKPSVDTCLNQFIFWSSYFHLVGPQKDLLKIGMLYFLSLNLKRNTHWQAQVSF